MPEYKWTGPIDCTIPISTTSLKDKIAIVTGGANGIGEAYVRALLSAGCYVVIGDLDSTAGERIVSESNGRATFHRTNVTSWADQVALFAHAAKFSPSGHIHYVVANAGIIKNDEIFAKSESLDPEKPPELSTIDVNINGTLYTAKLAMHYFIQLNGTTESEKQVDTCLILIGSGAGVHDCLRIPQYEASKWAARGIMHSLRRTSHYYGSRVNVINPWYVKTSILSNEVFEEIKAKGVEFATVEDAGQCLLRILGDSSVNGHSLFISARKWAKSGYMDIGLEDTEENDLRKEIQHDQMLGSPVSIGLWE
jgi:NAD(P)-dependent dehydrogenase (short-subunit alcohol dehydrogenase family)